jgi:hypothetical protein
MPFDGSEFFPQPLAPSASHAAESRSWWRRLTSAFGRHNQITSLLAVPAPEVAAIRALEEARDLIEDEHDWVQGAFSTVGGRHCAMGALDAVTRRAAQRNARRLARRFLLEVANRRGFRSVPAMNDHSSHRDVLSAFDEAIAAARREALVAA